jgi:hypothetical protein
MKKEYIKPSIEFIKLSPIQHLVASIQIDDNPGTVDIDVEDARENNIFDNNHSIWDNAW